MLRGLSMFGFAGVFLAVSPPLRHQVTGAIGSGVGVMESYAPYSYIGGGVLVLAFLMRSLYRGSKPR